MDLFICLLNFASAVSDLNFGKPVMFENKHFCNLSRFLWIVSSNMSIFLIAVLSIDRTFSVTLTFWKVKRLNVAFPVLIHLLTLLSVSSLPLIYNGYLYSKEATVWANRYNPWNRYWLANICRHTPSISDHRHFMLRHSLPAKIRSIGNTEYRRREDEAPCDHHHCNTNWDLHFMQCPNLHLADIRHGWRLVYGCYRIYVSRTWELWAFLQVYQLQFYCVKFSLQCCGVLLPLERPATIYHKLVH